MLDIADNPPTNQVYDGNGNVAAPNANVDAITHRPDYVRAMFKVTNFLVPAHLREGLFNPSESESEDEQPKMGELPKSTLILPTLSSIPTKPTSPSSSSLSPPLTLSSLSERLRRIQNPSQQQEAAAQFHSVAFEAQKHKQQQQQQQQQQLRQQYLKEQLSFFERAANRAQKLRKSAETVQDFAEKNWRETNKATKSLSNLGRALQSSSLVTPRQRSNQHQHSSQHSNRKSLTDNKSESDEPKGITLYLQPINHDLTFKTNSTVDKSTQI